jgi:hypothetical protein
MFTFSKKQNINLFVDKKFFSTYLFENKLCEYKQHSYGFNFLFPNDPNNNKIKIFILICLGSFITYKRTKNRFM